MHNISIFGTGSDAGKSTLTFVIARALQKRGISVVPFKAQNVSNNSRVADDGSEIAVSTWFQASVLDVKTSWHLNPVLLKSGAEGRVSLVLKGKERGDREVKAYFENMNTLKPAVEEGFSALNARYDCVVAEGAGGCVELNLLEKDLSNTFVAERFDTKIILVADIEKGGVFAQIYGTLALLRKRFRENLLGVVINKFRGDRAFFEDGVKIIEKEFGVPVLGVLPYRSLDLGFEDSASLFNYSRNRDASIRVGVIKLPHISNFTDFEPLVLDDAIAVEFIEGALEQYDLVCLPGSKRVAEDLAWLRARGLDEALKGYQGRIVAICGGYEMFHETIFDPHGVESFGRFSGLGMIPATITFAEEKIVRNTTVDLEGMRLAGYEIRYGRSDRFPLYYDEGRIFGTFLHAVFENDVFRNMLFRKIDPAYKGYCFAQKRREVIDAFVDAMEAELDMERIVSCIVSPR